MKAHEETYNNPEPREEATELYVLPHLNPRHFTKRVVVHCSDQDYYFDYADIVCIEACGNQTIFNIREGSIHPAKVVTCKTMREMEEALPIALFLRVHKSWLVNMQYVRGRKKGEIHHLQMCNLKQVPISETRLKQVLKTIEKFDSSEFTKL